VPARTAADEKTLMHWRNAIIAAFAIGGTIVSTWGPRLPAIRADLSVGTATIGLLVAGGTVGSIGGLLAAPAVLKALGGRRAMLVVILSAAASLALIGTATVLRSIPLVAVGFASIGFTLAILDVLINVEGTAVERQVGRTLMPRLHAAWSGGAALGSGIGAACAALSVSPGAQMLGLAVVIALCGVVLSRSIPAEAPPIDAVLSPTSRSQRIRQWLRGWTDVRVLLIGLVLLGVEFGEGSANTWLTLAAKDNHGESGAVAALFFSVFAISEAVTRLFGGPLVDRLGRVLTIRVTTGLGIAGVALFVLGHSPVLLLAGVICWAVGVSMGFPLGMSAAAEGGDDAAARVSVAASVGYFSTLVGPPVIGFLAQSLNLLSALWLVAILFVAASFAAGSLRPLPAAAAA
jgi:MFS family permease